jgi:hypothetical protein
MKWLIALQITDLSSRQRGRPTWRRKKVIVKQRKLKSGHGRQSGAWHQDELADWLSRNTIWTWGELDSLIVFLSWMDGAFHL